MKREDYITLLRLLLSVFQSTIERDTDIRLQTYYNLHSTIESFLPTKWVDGDNDKLCTISQIFLEQIEWNCSRQDWSRMAELCQQWATTVLVISQED